MFSVSKNKRVLMKYEIKADLYGSSGHVRYPDKKKATCILKAITIIIVIIITIII